MSRTDLIDVAPIREAVEASGLSYWAVAKHLGWERWSTVRCKNEPHAERVKVALGAKPTCSRGYRYTAETIDYSTAVRIAEACHLDPVDVGL